MSSVTFCRLYLAVLSVALVILLVTSRSALLLDIPFTTLPLLYIFFDRRDPL